MKELRSGQGNQGNYSLKLELRYKLREGEVSSNEYDSDGSNHAQSSVWNQLHQNAHDESLN